MQATPAADVVVTARQHDRPVRPVRVLQVIGSMHLGGAERVVAHLMRGLDPSSIAVGLCCTKQLGVLADDLRRESFDVTLAARPQSWLRHAIPYFVRRAISRFRPDIVHTHGTTALLHAGSLRLVGLMPPWVHTFHFGNYDVMSADAIRTERWLASRATQLVAVSEPQRRSVIERHGIAPERIVTIVNGVGPNPFVADPAVAARKRAALGFAPDEIVVGTIAVLSEQKGIPYLLAAARTLAPSHPKMRFLIVGGGPLEAALRAEAEALGLGGRIVFTGWREDSQELMVALDVFVMSSLWEAMPMVLLEAMAARRAIVVTDVGDNRTVVAHGHGGIVVPPRDGDAIASAVHAIVSTSGRAGPLSDAAERAYRERFSVERMCRDHERLYETVAARLPKRDRAS